MNLMRIILELEFAVGVAVIIIEKEDIIFIRSVSLWNKVFLHSINS